MLPPSPPLLGGRGRGDDNVIKIVKSHSRIIYVVEKSETFNYVKVMIGKIVVLQFFDYPNPDKNLDTTFRRVVGVVEGKQSTYVFFEGKRIFFKKPKGYQTINGLKQHNDINTKFITLDIETREEIVSVDGKEKASLKPYCISLYDGKKAWSFYLSDFNSVDDMLTAAIKSLMRNKYNNHSVYAHNLSKFDGIYLLRVLAQLGLKKPIIKDGNMIALPINWNLRNNKIGTITFKDSLLMLPQSLRSLAKSFNVEEKSYFPFKFVNNPNISLDYVGNIPSIDQWNDITQEQFDSLKQENWSLREESIKYCVQDCITLHQILVKFNELIFDKWSVNIIKFSTLPSLAFGIYRTKYMEENTIPKLQGQIFEDISKGYTGGHTDVYLPRMENAKHYDVNSLYPFVMSEFDMPVGPIHKFEGDIFMYEDNPFGFFLCKIKTLLVDGKPMERPLLQTKVKSDNGVRTIAPLGEWTDWLFSEEIKNVRELGGYKITVLKGYTFGRKNIFKEYINDMYQIKESYSNDRSNPMYLISKLLMNSLYGRFGMKSELKIHEIVKTSDIQGLQAKYGELSLVEWKLTHDLSLVSHPAPMEITAHNFWNDEFHNNINIAIAASVPAYARTIMNYYLADNTLIIGYMDTDCIVIYEVIPVSNELGKYKLEAKYKTVIFLGPKSYAGEHDNGKTFSKLKGYMNSTHWSVFLDLLKKDSSTVLNQTKMNRSLESGNIYLNHTSYKLKITDNKRQIIYNEFGEAINTKPYWIYQDDTVGKIIIPDPTDLSVTDSPLQIPENVLNSIKPNDRVLSGIEKRINQILAEDITEILDTTNEEIPEEFEDDNV